MAATWTKAAKIRRAFKSGKKRQKDLVLTPRRAVLEAYSVLHELRAAMAEAGLSEGDAICAVVYLSDAPEDALHVSRLPEPERMPEPYSKARQLEDEAKWTPLGIVFHQLDHEAANPADPKSGAYLWVQQWVMGDRATRALLVARNSAANVPGGTRSVN